MTISCFCNAPRRFPREFFSFTLDRQFTVFSLDGGSGVVELVMLQRLRNKLVLASLGIGKAEHEKADSVRLVSASRR